MHKSIKEISMFIRCICGKIHLKSFVGFATACTCGRSLYEQVFGRRTQ